MRAVFNGRTIAESDATILLEGNHYFPPESVDWQYLQRSWMKTPCYWKGWASYHHVVVDGDVARRAAWVYRHPGFLARRIKNHVAFWKGVDVFEQ